MSASTDTDINKQNEIPRPPPGLPSFGLPPGAPGAAALTPTIFHEPWWLDAASDGAWQEVQVASGGRVIGRFPFVLNRQLGHTTIGMPMLTHFLGPAVDEGHGTASTRQLKRISITRELIASLPKAASLWVKFHRGVTDTLAFQREGYRNEVQFTCEIAPAPEAELWAGLRTTERRVIRRAADELRVTEEQDPERFLAFYERNLTARGLNNNYIPAICMRVISECQQRGAGRILVAADERGEPSAAIFTIWDSTSEYYLMSTRRPDAHNGATGMLIWAAVRHAAARQLIFDLDGISTLGDMQFLTRFGGIVQPRYFVHSATMPFRIIRRASDQMYNLFRHDRRAAGSG